MWRPFPPANWNLISEDIAASGLLHFPQSAELFQNCVRAFRWCARQRSEEAARHCGFKHDSNIRFQCFIRGAESKPRSKCVLKAKIHLHLCLFKHLVSALRTTSWICSVRSMSVSVSCCLSYLAREQRSNLISGCIPSDLHISFPPIRRHQISMFPSWVFKSLFLAVQRERSRTDSTWAVNRSGA